MEPKDHYRIYKSPVSVLILSQINPNNVMHFLFILLRIKSPSAVCATPPEDEQVMLETCRGP
jgi:hypothetical protein